MRINEHPLEFFRPHLQKGWTSLALVGRIFRHSVHQAKKIDLATMASGLAYTTIFSIVPLLAVVFYVFRAFGGLEYGYEKLEPFLLKNLSEGTGETVVEHLRGFIHNVHAAAIGWAGIATLLFTALMTYFTVTKIFNRIWEVTIRQKIHHRVLRPFTLMTLGPILAVLSILATTVIASQIHALPFSAHIAALLLNILLYTIVYALVPTVVEVPLITIMQGSILPSILWEFAKMGYTTYTSRFVKYSTFYGSLAAVPMFLLWIYIAWYITLFGAVWIRSLHLHKSNKALS